MRLGRLLARIQATNVDEIADALARIHAERRDDGAAIARAEHDPGRVVRGARRVLRWAEELHRVQARVVDLLLPSASREAPPDDEVDAAVLSLMRRAARLLLKHPVAAQAAFAALVAEGRAFAATEEGARYEAALRRSPAIERSFRAFEMLTGNVLLESPDVVLPSGYLDLLVQTGEIRDLGPYFQRLLADEEP